MEPRESRYKQAIVVRLDLKMSKGKIAGQCAHAAIGASEEAKKRFPDWWKEWMADGQSKIVLKVKSEEEILDLGRIAAERGLPISLVRDRGLTQIPSGTITCIGIGPAPAGKIDVLTGGLRLL